MYTTVYRVERYGFGPYNQENRYTIKRRLDKHYADVNNHPGIWSDTKLFSILRDFSYRIWSWDTLGLKQHYCGFISMESLREWFENDLLEDLLRDGYQIKQYRVPVRSVFIGSYQVMFHHKYMQ